jgi:hypothetical protein
MVLDQHSRAEQNFLDLTLASPLALPARRCPLFQAGATATAIAVQSAVRQNRQLLKDCAASSASAADFRASTVYVRVLEGAVGIKLSDEWAFLALFLARFTSLRSRHVRLPDVCGLRFGWLVVEHPWQRHNATSSGLRGHRWNS